MSSNTLTPFKAAGLVAGGTQLCLQTLGSKCFLTTSIGRAFQVYRTDHLTLSMVSRPGKRDITHVAAHKEHTFAATSEGITIWDRARHVATLRWAEAPREEGGAPACDDDSVDVVALLVEGELLFSLHVDDVIRVWEWKRALSPVDPRADVLQQIVRLPVGTGVSCMAHPPTYVNKLALGTRSGSVIIVNVRTGAAVYECMLCPGTPITAVVASPAVDVVGVGTSDGRVLLHNVRLDEAVASFSHALTDDAGSTGGGGQGSAITALTFSVDSTLFAPTLASATESGGVALWDLEKKRLIHSLPTAHAGSILFLAFLPRQPLLLSAGADNAVRVFAIDRLEGVPKLLRSRSGHQAPPRLIRYYGGAAIGSLATGADASACEIISAGSDRSVRLFHTALPRQDVELSQGKLSSRAKVVGVHPSALRLPQVVAMAANDRRRGQWADVVTCHAGSGQAVLWSWEAKRVEERVLVLPDSGRESAISVNITACGNFAVVGGTAGTVCMFNMQSGAQRGVFPPDPSLSLSFNAKGKKRAKGGLHAADGEGGTGDFGPVDKDVGKARGPGHNLHVVDSIDTTLFKGIGVLPPKVRAMQEAAGQGGAVSQHAQRERTRHRAAVYGVGSDAMNKVVISADAEGRVVWWDFTSHAYVGEVVLPSAVTAMVVARDAGLAALPCDDFAVRVVDVATRRLVRTFVGHTNRVTDVCFTPDCRWLTSASLDRSIRVWDLPTARCIDWCTLTSPVVSLAWSPTGEFLATAHADSPALNLWANRAHFGAVPSETAPSRPFPLDMPRLGEEEDVEVGSDSARNSSTGQQQQGKEKKRRQSAVEKLDDDEGFEEDRGAAGTRTTTTTTTVEAAGTHPLVNQVEHGPVVPKVGCRITLSGKPESAWVDLPRLDAIQARNKPKAPPKKPDVVPFFLLTTGGLAPTFLPPVPLTAGSGGVPAHFPAVNAGEGGWEGGDSAMIEEDGQQSGGGGAASTSRVLDRQRGTGRQARSVLAGLLRACDGVHGNGSGASTSMDVEGSEGGAVAALRAHLHGSTPQALDIEVRTLCVGGPEVDPDGCALLAAFMRYLAGELRGGGAGFELSNAHIGLLLSAYRTVLADAVAAGEGEARAGDDAMQGEEGAARGGAPSLYANLLSAITTLRAAQCGDSVRLRDLLDKASCMVQLFLGQ